ncbi:MAG: hypothetical protein RQ743_13580 [Bacteroidales bacterium]|jgi:hypothetical protein|nr:hypothetical protein [Bacteroidales bacterium]
MKKFIYLFALAGLFMLGMQSVNAQWSFDVKNVDIACDCETITTKTLEYSIYDLVIDDYLVNPVTTSLPATETFTLSGSESIIIDQQDRYVAVVRISYFDPTLCCTGWNSYTFDSDELLGGDITIIVTLD